MDIKQRQARFLRDLHGIRLANIASNLARIASLSRHANASEIIASVLYESKYFCEWAAIEAVKDDVEMAALLATLQRQLVCWERQLAEICADSTRRAEMSATAREWSDRLLQLSGLLNPVPAS